MLIEVIDDFWTQLFLRCRSIELKKKKKSRFNKNRSIE